MAELIRLLLEILKAASPVRIVAQWELGLVLIAGKYRGTVGPGLKVIIPGLCDIRCVSMVPDISSTSMQTVTLRDGRALAYSASITFKVVDARLAYLTVGRYAETVVELASRLLSDGIADAEPERFDPARGKRGRLIEELREDIDAACRVYGVSAIGLGFNNFVMAVPTVRLLLDPGVLAAGNHFAAN